MAAAGVLDGMAEHTALVIASDEPAAVWRERLRFAGPVRTLPPFGGGAGASFPSWDPPAPRRLRGWWA